MAKRIFALKQMVAVNVRSESSGSKSSYADGGLLQGKGQNRGL